MKKDIWGDSTFAIPLLGLPAPYDSSTRKVPSANDIWGQYEDDKNNSVFKTQYKTVPYTVDYNKMYLSNPNSYIIDYSNNLNTTKDASDKYTKSMLDIMDSLKASMGLSLLSSLSPANPNATVNIVPQAPTFLDKYPIENKDFQEYSRESTILSPKSLLYCQEILEEIDKLSQNNVPVFIGRLREIRNIDGDINDPWSRSIPVFRNNFKVGSMFRKQTLVKENYCHEILVWIVDTSVEKIPVKLILWEEVRISYIRKSTINNFLDGLHPYINNKTPSYEI